MKIERGEKKKSAISYSANFSCALWYINYFETVSIQNVETDNKF